MLLMFLFACGEAEIEFQDLTADEPGAVEAEEGGQGEVGEAGGAPTEGTNGDIESIQIGENGVEATAGGGTGAHATVGGDQGVYLGAGGEEGGAQVDIANGAFEANAGGGEEFKVQIGRNNEVGIEGKKVKVGNKEVDFGKK